VILARVTELTTGAAAALESPLWLRAGKLNQLLAAPTLTMRRQRDSGVAVRAALRMLRLLARLRLPPWRNTCLYRSIAECLVLRRYGVPCRMQIGVAARTAADGAIHAHAWVVRLEETEAALVLPRMAVLQ
jgi:hypothetical protein